MEETLVKMVESNVAQMNEEENGISVEITDIVEEAEVKLESLRRICSRDLKDNHATETILETRNSKETASGF